MPGPDDRLTEPLVRGIIAHAGEVPVFVRMLGWLTNKDNRETVTVLLAVATALCGGAWFVFDRMVPTEPGPPPTPAQSVAIAGDVGDVQQVGPDGIAVIARDGATVVIGYTIAQHEERLARREAEIVDQLESERSSERETLLGELEEVRGQMADARASFEQRRIELARAIARLDEVAAGLPEVRLATARAALAEGDTTSAEAIFAEIAAQEAEAVERAAVAAFELGKLTEDNIRWREAADHFARAARLAPTFEHLEKAHQLALRMADHAAALRYGQDLVAAAIAEDGPGSARHGEALRLNGSSVAAVGRYQEAERLYREALEITERALGPNHRKTASALNSLGVLLSISPATPKRRRCWHARRRSPSACRRTTRTTRGKFPPTSPASSRIRGAMPRRSPSCSTCRGAATGPTPPI